MKKIITILMFLIMVMNVMGDCNTGYSTLSSSTSDLTNKDTETPSSTDSSSIISTTSPSSTTESYTISDEPSLVPECFQELNGIPYQEYQIDSTSNKFFSSDELIIYVEYATATDLILYAFNQNGELVFSKEISFTSNIINSGIYVFFDQNGNPILMVLLGDDPYKLFMSKFNKNTGAELSNYVLSLGSSLPNLRFDNNNLVLENSGINVLTLNDNLVPTTMYTGFISEYYSYSIKQNAFAYSEWNEDGDLIVHVLKINTGNDYKITLDYNDFEYAQNDHGFEIEYDNINDVYYILYAFDDEDFVDTYVLKLTFNPNTNTFSADPDYFLIGGTPDLEAFYINGEWYVYFSGLLTRLSSLDIKQITFSGSDIYEAIGTSSGVTAILLNSDREPCVAKLSYDLVGGATCATGSQGNDPFEAIIANMGTGTAVYAVGSDVGGGGPGGETSLPNPPTFGLTGNPGNLAIYGFEIGGGGSSEVPEFSTIALIIAVLGGIMGIFVMRKRR